MKNTKLKGNLMLLLTAFIWGVSFIAQSKGVEEISAVAFNGIRSILGGLVLLPVIYIIDSGKRKHNQPVEPINKTLVWGGIACGIILCLASTIQTIGLKYTSPGKGGFITALYMVIVPIIGLFTGKKLRPILIAAVLVAVCGLYLMCISTDISINKGDVLIFICAFLFAAHILVIDKVSPLVDGVKLSCIQFFVCGIINVIWMFAFEEPQLKPILNSWIPIAYAGVCSCGIAYTLQIVGQKYTDPTSASILMSLESLFATLANVILVAMGWNLTGGQLTVREVIGCILMFAAIMLVQLPEKNKENEKAAITG